MAIKSNDNASKAVVGTVLEDVVGGGRGWVGLEGDGAGRVPAAIQLLERVDFGGIVR